MDSSYQCTYSLSTKTFWNLLILRQGVKIISYGSVSFTVICLLPAACTSRENHCPIFPVCFFKSKCKQCREYALTLTLGAPLGCPLCQNWGFLVVCWAAINPAGWSVFSLTGFIQDSSKRKQKLQTRMPSLWVRSHCEYKAKERWRSRRNPSSWRIFYAVSALSAIMNLGQGGGQQQALFKLFKGDHLMVLLWNMH